MMHQRVLVRIESNARLKNSGFTPATNVTSTHKNWLEVAASSGHEAKAKELSELLETFAVYWSVSSGTDQIELVCYRNGRLLRRLSCEEGHWRLPLGEATPFENPAAMQTLLKRESLVATHDGYALLEAFLGNEPVPESSLGGHIPELIELVAAAARTAPTMDDDDTGEIVGLLSKFVHLGPLAEYECLSSLAGDASLPEWFRDFAKSFAKSSEGNRQ